MAAEAKPKLKSIADIYAVEDARREARPTPANPVSQSAPVPQTAPVTESSPVRIVPQARSETALVPQTAPVSQTAPTYNLAEFAATLDLGKGHSRINHELFDSVITRLDAYEQLLFIHLLRYRKGDTNLTVVLSLPRLATRMRVSEKTVQRAFRSLESSGLVEREAFKFGGNKEQGATYRLVLPTGQVSQTAPVRQSSPVSQTPIKETHIKEHTTQEPVRVGSRFDLQECRRYAESLRSEGINNPGGYATRLHRSGEADELIAAFLAPAEVAPKIDVSLCPDCSGSGWRYPAGKDKGTARCKHERMLREEPSIPS